MSPVLKSFTASLFIGEFNNRKGSWTPDALKEELARLIGPLEFLSPDHVIPGEMFVWHPATGQSGAEAIQDLLDRGCQGFILLPATTGSEWFKEHIAPRISKVLFLRGRIKEADSRPIIDSMLFILDGQSGSKTCGKAFTLQSLIMNHGMEMVPVVCDESIITIGDPRLCQEIREGTLVSATLKLAK